MKKYNLFYIIVSFTDWRLETIHDYMPYAKILIDWYKIFPNCYVVSTRTDITADDVYRYLDDKIFTGLKLIQSSRDDVVIMEINTDIQGWMSKESWDKVNNLLRNQYTR